MRWVPRKKTARSIEEAVLTESARRCAFCFGLDGSLAQVDGQIAHVDRNHANADENNLAWLCLRHHNAYDSRSSQAKGLIPGELRIYRDRLYAAIRKNLHFEPDSIALFPTKIRSDVLKHDRRIFQRLDAVIDESALVGLLEHVASVRAIRDDDYDILFALRAFFELESNAFLVDDVVAAATKYRAQLVELVRFLGQNFFVTREGESELPRREEDPDRYYRLVEELGEHAFHARDSYLEFRRTIKRSLVI